MVEQDEALIMDYVLGELDEVTSARLEARLENEPNLADELSRCEETVAMALLADTSIADVPRASLRDEIASISAPTAEPKPETVERPRASVNWVSFGGWGVAAALAVVAAVSADRASQRGTEVQALQAQLEERREAVERVTGELEAVVDERELLANRIAQLNSTKSLDQMRIATLSSQLDKASYGFAVFDMQADEGVIEVVNLPEIKATQDYQLWVVDPQYPNPVDGGIVQVSTDGRASIRFQAKQPVENVAAFAISLEVKGGVPVAQGPMVLVGSL